MYNTIKEQADIDIKNGKIEEVFKEANIFMKNGSLSLAAEIFKLLANSQHPESEYIYATILENGMGAEKDEFLAGCYYKSAADKGHVDSANNYARIQYNLGNFRDAAKYFKMAADNGNEKAIYNYGVLLYNGLGVEMDRELAGIYFKRAADMGNQFAMFNFAVLSEELHDLKNALEYFTLAANKGDEKAKTKLQEMQIHMNSK